MNLNAFSFICEGLQTYTVCENVKTMNVKVQHNLMTLYIHEFSVKFDTFQKTHREVARFVRE